MNHTMSDIGTLLRTRREALGLRQEDVVLSTGSSVKFLSGIERNGPRPRTPFADLRTLVEALGGTIEIRFPDESEDQNE
ncbi:helix-turn-helix domain-containing protein [Thalassospira xianhensis]|uniref:helix-turn-helix domain-containing protein n=1 Tax=Thalassospira xianhensis TaxID=478503 RepID=UPI000DEE09C2